MKRAICSACFGAAAVAFAAVPVLAGPPVVIHPVVLEGYNVPGVGNIPSGAAAINNLAVNNGGQWLVEADTDHADTNADVVVVRGTGFAAPPLSLYLRENDPVDPPGANISSFDSININNGGHSGFNFFLRNTGGTTNDSGVYFDTTLLIQESNISMAAGFSPNTPYIGWFDVKINNLNQLMLVASVDDPAIATTVDRALVRVDLNPFTETVYTKEGDPYFGFAAADFGTGPHSSTINDSAHMLFSVDTTDANTATDGAIIRHDGTSGTVLAREGMPSAVTGRNWGTLIDTAVDMNNSGDWVMRGDLDGTTTDDSLIVRNGTLVVAREGFSLPEIGGVFTFTSFGTGAVKISDSGDVFWVGDWNDPDTTRDVGIFMNDMLLVQEGVTLVDGILLSSISVVQDNFSISDDGRWLIFEGALADGREGAFLVEVPEPATLALIVAGCVGLVRRRARAGR